MPKKGTGFWYPAQCIGYLPFNFKNFGLISIGQSR